MSLIQFHLDTTSGVPFYVQLIQQVRQALLFGMLRAGDQLPTVKDVVSQVALNPNTVLRAYRDLEHEGVVVSRPGLGTFITANAPRSMARDQYRPLRADLERWIRKARSQDLDENTIAALFEHVLRESTRAAIA
jgi:GntR family transcriptional regulator